MKQRYLTLLTIMLMSLTLLGCQSSPALTLTLYTDRHYDTDEALYASFFEQTGIRIQVLNLAADPLITRLENEGSATPADLLFLTDAGRLGRAKEKALFQTIPTVTELALVPNYLKDDDLHWIGLTKRARVLVYDANRTTIPADFSYEDLTDAQWFNRVVTRSSSHVYNQSLVASMLALHDEAYVASWLNGLVNNFATRGGSKNPVGNDRDQAKAVYEGIADIAIMNTYYLGRMKYGSSVEEQQIAERLTIHFPNQLSSGTHVNVSGIGMLAASKKHELVQQFMSFMLSESTQAVFSQSNFEYPTRQGVALHPLLYSWGEFIEQTVPLSEFAGRSLKAYELMLEAGWF